MAAPNGQIFPAESEADPAANEPSMEDILASIRRIIASDNIGAPRSVSPFKFDEGLGVSATAGADTPAAAANLQPPAPYVPVEHVRIVVEPPVEYPGLDDLGPLVSPPAALEPEVSVEDVRGPLLRDADQAASAPHSDSEPPDVTPRTVYDLQPEDLVFSAADAEPLISSSAGASVSSSFQALTDTMLMRDPEMLDRIAREALRPMLKTWLDENLPSMVERLVRAEIERVARGGR